MGDITITIRLARGQTVELTPDEVIELRDTLQRLYPAPAWPLVPARETWPGLLWPPVPLYVGDVVPNPFEVTCGAPA